MLQRQISDSLSEIQRERQQTLARFCSLDPYPNKTAAMAKVRRRVRNFLVDDRHQFIFCYIPKVACTNWKRIMLVLTGKVGTKKPEELGHRAVHYNLEPRYLMRGKEYPWEQLEDRLNRYYKFMFVREPMERLLSAYIDKFGTPDQSTDYHKRYGRGIIKSFRKNPTNESLTTGGDVTFSEFVQSVDNLWSRDALQAHNEHWMRYQDLCHPCAVRYDYIGKYETLDQDTTRILRVLNVTHLVQMPEKQAEYTGSRTEEKMRKYFRQLAPKEVSMLGGIYLNDSHMFGYPDAEDVLRGVGLK